MKELLSRVFGIEAFRSHLPVDPETLRPLKASFDDRYNGLCHGLIEFVAPGIGRGMRIPDNRNIGFIPILDVISQPALVGTSFIFSTALTHNPIIGIIAALVVKLGYNTIAHIAMDQTSQSFTSS